MRAVTDNRKPIISNGRLLGRSTRSGRTTWSWELARPVSSYLVTFLPDGEIFDGFWDLLGDGVRRLFHRG